MENLKKMLKEKKEFSFACVIIIILLVITIWLALSKQIPKTKDGSEVVVSVKGYEVTADQLYAELKSEKGTTKALNLIDTFIADKEVKFSDEDEEYVDNVVDYYKQYAEYYGVSFEDFLALVGLSASLLARRSASTRSFFFIVDTPLIPFSFASSFRTASDKLSSFSLISSPFISS